MNSLEMSAVYVVAAFFIRIVFQSPLRKIAVLEKALGSLRNVWKALESL